MLGLVPAYLAECEAALEVKAPALSEIQVTPASAKILVADSQQYQAWAILDNGDSLDVTEEVTWRSADTGIAAVGQSGLASGLAAGDTRIEALLNEGGTIFQGDAGLEVQALPVTIDQVVVTPFSQTILAGDTLQYTATAILSDGSKVDITPESSWSSSNPAIATLDSQGLAYGLAAGTVTVEAAINFEGTRYSGATDLNVELALEIKEVLVTPRTEELLVDETAQFMATAVLSDDASVSPGATTRGMCASDWLNKTRSQLNIIRQNPEGE